MAEPQRLDSDDPDDPGAAGLGSRPPATPRWVKVTGVVVGFLLLVAVAKALLGGGVGGHGPGMHGGLGGVAPGAPASGWALAPAWARP